MLQRDIHEQIFAYTSESKENTDGRPKPLQNNTLQNTKQQSDGSRCGLFR